MKRKGIVILFVLATLSALVTNANAHIPVVPIDGTTLATATAIESPWKSWFYYSELPVGEAHYYKFEAIEGDRLRFMLNIPIEEGDRGFNPVFVLMGPGIIDQGTPPAFLETPESAGVMIVEPDELEPEYEGFTPMSQYMTADVNMSAPETGTYYIAVYEQTSGGRYALVTGFIEEYSLFEWLAVPLMVINLLQWSGQNVMLILLPMFIPFLIGIAYILTKRRNIFSENRLQALAIVGSLFFLGSALSIFYQMVFALLQAPPNWTISATFIFGLLPLLLAFLTIRTVQTDAWQQKRGQKIKLLLIALVGPFVWAGLYIGPLLVFVVGLIPMVTSRPVREVS